MPALLRTLATGTLTVSLWAASAGAQGFTGWKNQTVRSGAKVSYCGTAKLASLGKHAALLGGSCTKATLDDPTSFQVWDDPRRRITWRLFVKARF